jgi:hypothetical protein
MFTTQKNDFVPQMGALRAIAKDLTIRLSRETRVTGATSALRR